MSFNYTNLDYSQEVFTSFHFSDLLLDFEENIEQYNTLRRLYLQSQSIVDPNHPINIKDPSLDIKYIINLKSFQYIVRLAQLGYQRELDFTLPEDYEDRMDLTNNKDDDNDHDNNKDDNNDNNNDNNNHQNDQNNNKDDKNDEPPPTSQTRYTTYPDGSQSTHLISKQDELSIEQNNSLLTTSQLIDQYEETFFDPDVKTDDLITDSNYNNDIKIYDTNQLSKINKFVSFSTVIDKVNEHLEESLLISEKPDQELFYNIKHNQQKFQSSYEQFKNNKDYYVHQFHRQLKINSDSKNFYYKLNKAQKIESKKQQLNQSSIKELPNYNTAKSTYNKHQSTQFNNNKPPLNHNQIISVSKHSTIKQISTNLSTVKRFKNSLNKQFKEITSRLKTSFHDKRYFKINYNKNKNDTYDIELKININTKHDSNKYRQLSLLSLSETTHLWYKFNNTVFYKNKYYVDKTKSRYSYM